MPPAATSTSSWAPLASFSTPIPPDADILTTDKPETAPCPTPEKTPGLLVGDDDDDDEDSRIECPASAVPPPTPQKTRFCEKGSDFYSRYSAHWQFGYDEYSNSGGGDRTRTSWGDTGEGPSCHTGREEEQEDSDQEQGGETFVEHSRRMASWAGQPAIKGRNEIIRMMLLCAVHFGISFTWGVEMTCETYLLSSRCMSLFVEWHADGGPR